MKPKICILTTTRADYGILKPLIHTLIDDGDFDVKLAVTGTHLITEFGYTYDEIIKDGFPVEETIPISYDTNSSASVSNSIGETIIQFGKYFEKHNYDLLFVLGDRYETLAVCIAAMTHQIPIAHLHGGETTEGAIDEAIRHAITKMSLLHFTSTELYRNRVIQLGEHPNRVFHVGALGIDNIKHTQLLSKDELSNSISVSLSRPFALVTYHPVTLEKEDSTSALLELFDALSIHENYTYLFTYANADKDGSIINRLVDQFCDTHNNAYAFPSLGMLRYLSACKYASFVIGNSSSGILEVPSFGIPTINIGDRQKGRLQSESIINCSPTKEAISKAILYSQSMEFQSSLSESGNIYGDGHASERILCILKKHFNNIQAEISLKKPFYDVPLTKEDLL